MRKSATTTVASFFCWSGWTRCKARNVFQDWCVERYERAKDRDEQLGPEDVFSPMPPSEGLKMLVSTMMNGHDDGNHVDGPFEVVTWV